MAALRGRVLIIAGSDSGGGAGIQADIKTITALGAYASTAITALTAQNTLGVQGVLPVPPAFVRQQIDVVLDDIGADAIKIGMLADVPVIEIVADALQSRPRLPLVLDPVMVAKGGARLLAPPAVRALMDCLFPLATVITPNLPEAEALVGRPVPDLPAMREAAASLLQLGAAAVLLKGGHLLGDILTDLLVTAGGCEEMVAQRIDTRHTHGTGCTLASAIAAGLAQGLGLSAAVHRARDYVQRAIATAPGFGGGHGPLNHAITIG